MRDKILETIVATLAPLDFVLALWQGGSDAHGYTDEWSDIDVVAIADDEQVETTFDRLEAGLQALSIICSKYRVPEPTWHGHSQCFYRLADTSLFLWIDFAVMKRSSPNHFLGTERHGNSVIAFDKANLLTIPAFDWAAHLAKMEAQLAQLQSSFDLRQALVHKEIHRGHLASAIANYFDLTLQPLIELLGMIYRPERYDFGFKYFDRDFPAAIKSQVESLFLIADLADLAEKQQIAAIWFTKTLPQAAATLQQRTHELSSFLENRKT